MGKHLFSKENQPDRTRGRTRRKLIVEALERKGLSEEQFYDKIVEMAVIEGSEPMLRELLIRFNPVPKPVAPEIQFDFPENGTPTEKVNSIIAGVADGKIPTDLGKMITDMLKTACDVHESTELSERLDKLETMLAEQQAADGA